MSKIGDSIKHAADSAKDGLATAKAKTKSNTRRSMDIPLKATLLMSTTLPLHSMT